MELEDQCESDRGVLLFDPLRFIILPIIVKAATPPSSLSLNFTKIMMWVVELELLN